MSTPSNKRPPAIPLVETIAWQGRELDIHTVDRGPDHLVVLTNLYVDGQLLVTRRVPYLSTADTDRVAMVMQHHQSRLLHELRSGALDKELLALFAGEEPWARPPAPPARAFPSVPLTPMPEQVHTPLPVPHQPPPVTEVARTPPAAAAAPPPGPPQLSLVLEEPAALLPLLLSSNGRLTGVRVETLQRVELGAPVEVAVRFLGRPIRQFYMQGTVSAHRPAGQGSVQGDLGVTVLPADLVALERVKEFALGQHDPTTDRQSPRVRFNASATLVMGTERIQSARILNISEGGAMLGKTPPLIEGTRFTIGFSLPDGTALHLPAVSRWFRTDGEPLTGIQFTHVEDSQARIAALVASLLKGP